ncbi:MAG: ketoacyl-ACP synthase III [Bryobacteraceae bacterium]|jgi:3-oxoacyl-[acyl-carrier-protein] synthase-3
MKATVAAIEYVLPEHCLTNGQLAAEFPEWSVEKIEEKTGIAERWIAAEGECSSDLGTAAAQRLFESGVCKPADVDYLLFCTQSPDHFLPTSACVMQQRLGVPTSAGALDFNLGCSGYVYGLGLAQALIETGQATNVLLVTAETYSKFIHPRDKSVRTLFGDAGAATLVRGAPEGAGFIGPFVYGTDGSGAGNLIVPTGGMRQRLAPPGEEATVDADGNLRTQANLYMNGPEIFAFTLRAVPKAVHELLARAGKDLGDVDLYVFHQANRYMLEHLRKKLKIPVEKFFVGMRHCGNTVSCTIPIALKQAANEGRIQPGHLVMLVGFGVGYSWAATLIRWG